MYHRSPRLYLTALIPALVFLFTNSSRADNIKVVLMGGQSNMWGFGDAVFLPSNLKNPQTDVLFYNGYNAAGDSTVASLTTLAPPNQIDPGYLTFGPEISFGRKMADDHPGDSYALIKYAVGGTSLATDWNPTTPGPRYTAFKNTVTSGLQALIDAGHTPEIVGMLWLQGENDASVTAQANAYQTNLLNLIADIRLSYGANLPFIIGGIGYTADPGRATVQAAQQYAEDHLTNVRYFSNDDINEGNELHFNAFDMQTIGQRFAVELQAVPEPSTYGLILLGGGLFFCASRKKAGRV